MRLGIDLDGVVADFNAGWMARYNAEHGTDLTPEMVTEWHAMIPLTRFSSISEFWHWIRSDSGVGFFSNLPVFPEALGALDRLSRNHEIVIITAKPRWATSETFEWIAKHGIETREVHITHDKWRVDCDIFLDDGTHNLTKLVVERPDRTICRFVRPWNEPVAGTIDIDSWETFETLVDRRFC